MPTLQIIRRDEKINYKNRWETSLKKKRWKIDKVEEIKETPATIEKPTIKDAAITFFA